MKRLITLAVAACLMLSLLLCGCGEAATSTPVEEAPAETPAPSAFVAAPVTAVEKDTEEKTEELSDMVADPSYDIDFETALAGDFGDYFTADYSCETDSYRLLAGDAYENTVTVIKGQEEGPVIYIVAGVHGDEEAAWRTGQLMKKVGIKAGTLYVLAPANPWGAEKVPKSRYVDGKDMNRSFPGKSGGTNAERVANAIYSDIRDKAPDFVFDLHEAIIVEEGRDYLGSSLIFTRLDGMEDMFMDLYLATEAGEICSEPFTYFEAVSGGSINNSVTTGLGIPVITVETFRGYEMATRVSDQLAIVQYVLRYYGLV